MADRTPPHGTTYRYGGRWHCRCEDCSAAHRRSLIVRARDLDPEEAEQHARSHGIPEGHVRSGVLAGVVARQGRRRG